MEENESLVELDAALERWGDQYSMRYIGCIGIKNSMRTLTHQSRSMVAKASIFKLCDANRIKRNTDRKCTDFISNMLQDEPNLSYSGTDVHLQISSTHLNVILRGTQEIIIQHVMQDVSFASIGDDDTVGFIAYVAKNFKFGRSCFVLKASPETAQNVFATIGRGFTQNSRKFMHHMPDSPCNVGTDDNVTTRTRDALMREPWYHGSYLSREASETRLKQNGDFLVRESMIDPGHFVLSVMHDETKLHFLFDSMGDVRTKEMTFEDISDLVKYHHNQGLPIVANNRIVYLRNGVRSSTRISK